MMLNKTILKTLIISIILGIQTHCTAAEFFRFYPVLGEIKSLNESSYVSNASSNFLTYKLYQNTYLYDDRTESTINRYLIIKALEIGLDENSEYKKDLEVLDHSFQVFDEALNKCSIEKTLTELLGDGSVALLGLSTDILGKELSISGFLSHILKLVLEQDAIKNILMEELNISQNKYDLYKDVIVGSVDLTLSVLDKYAWETMNKKMFIQMFSNSFSKFVGIPIAVYEATLNTARIGMTATTLYSLSVTNNDHAVRLWASSFIYDYVNKYKGDIEKIKNDVQKYTYSFGPSGVYMDGDKYSPTVKTFWDIFYWYTVENLNIQSVNINKNTTKVNLVKAARLALDLIEQYGNGGLFGCHGYYQLEVTDDKFIKKLFMLEKEIAGTDFLYYMPTIQDDRNNESNILFDFYAFGYTPNLDYLNLNLDRRHIYYTVNLNLEYVNKWSNIYSQYFINNDINKLNRTEYIYGKVAPEVTIIVKDRFNNDFEEKTIKYKSFYIPYGYFPNLNNGKITFGKEAFVDIYNRGLLPLNYKEFHYDEGVITDYFLKLIYSYLNLANGYDYSGKIRNDFYWKQCVNDGLCGQDKLLGNRIDFIKRGQVAEFVTSKIDFNVIENNVLKQIASSDLSGWTEAGRILYRYGIMKGDSNKNMNQDDYIRIIELFAILGNIKGLTYETK